MKKEIKATLMASILAVGLIGGTAIAQTANDITMTQQSMRAAMMRGNMMGNNVVAGNMMGVRGSGTMHGGMGGSGIMHGGMGLGQGMMTQGNIGCMKMMGQGMGMMGGGMMGGGMMFDMAPENQQKFMDDTREARKKMHDMRFDYMEAMRNPETRLGDVADMEQKMLDVRKEMLKKAEKYQRQQ